MKRKKIKIKRKKRGWRHLSSKDQLKKARDKLKDLNIKRRRTFIHLICTKCKRDCKIHTNRPELYTEERTRDYICLLCR